MGICTEEAVYKEQTSGLLIYLLPPSTEGR